MACPTTTTARLSVLVVDDSEDYLEAVTHLLTTYSWIERVDQALSASEALTKLVLERSEGRVVHPPDLMLVDLAMPGVSGLDLTRIVKAMPTPPKVIIVTLYETPTYREAAKTAGADGFLGKSQMGEGLQGAIERIFPELLCGH